MKCRFCHPRIVGAGLALWLAAGCGHALADNRLPLDQPEDAAFVSALPACPYAVRGQAGIREGALRFTLDLDPATMADGPHERSLLKQTGFAILVDPFRNAYRCYVITVSFAGPAAVHLMHTADHFVRLPDAPQVVWDRGADRGRVSVAVSLAALGIEPGEGDEWGLGFGLYALDAAQAPVEYWSIAGAGGHMWSHRTGFLYPWVFVPYTVGRGAAGLSSTRGNLAHREVFADNRFAWTWLAPPANGTGTLNVAALTADGGTAAVRRVTFPYAEGQPAFVNAAYPCPEPAQRMRFEIDDAAGRSIYRSVYPVCANMPNRFPSPKDHFRPEALRTVAPDPRLRGANRLTWYHGVRAEHMRLNALDLGYAYDVEEWYAYLARTRQILIAGHPNPFSGYQLDSPMGAYARRFGVPIAMMPTAAAVKKEVPFPPGREHQVFLADPRAREAFLAALRDGLTRHGDIVRYVYFGSELEDSLIQTTVYLWQEARDRYPPIGDVDREIRRQFGHGQYGIPTSSNWRFQLAWSEPYHWIAVRRWAADFIARLAADVRREALAIRPDVLLIAPDPKAGNRSQYYETWRGLFDIATFQVALKPVPEEQPFAGFGTKLIRDLSGIRDVWPCLHTEAMLAFYSPDEIREVLSQAFIAGATGTMTWPIPGRGALAFANRLNDPWGDAMEQEFCDLVGKGVEALHAPEADVALLYAGDTCAAEANEYGLPQPPRAYQYLSDGCGASFRFVGDAALERDGTLLRGCKVLVVPAAGIERVGATRRVLAAVRDGLNLVVLDPAAFERDTSGADTEALARRLRGGIRRLPRPDGPGGAVHPDPSSALLREALPAEGLTFVGADFLYPYNDLTPYRATCAFDALPADGQVLLRYADGAPAAVQTAVGRGRVVWTGFNPLLASYNAATRAFLRAVLGDLGVALDRPEWRLRLPLTEGTPGPARLHLTGNGFMPRCGVPQTAGNVRLPGTYRYRTAPDRVRDVDPDGDAIAFGRGKLTDRANRVEKRDSRFVTYAATNAVRIDFDLSGPCVVSEVHVYLADYAPAAALLVCPDDDSAPAVSVAEAEEGGPVSGVRRLALSGGGKRARIWRLELGGRPAGQTLTIAEVDFLQDPPADDGKR